MQPRDTHVHHVEVTFDMLDPGNLLYHPQYLVLADRARSSTLAALGCPPAQLWADGFWFVVAELSTRYLLPVSGGARLAILTQMPLRSARTLKVTQRFVLCEQLTQALPDGTFVDGATLPVGTHVVCELEAKLVCVNVTQRCVAPVPDALARQLCATFPTDSKRETLATHSGASA